MMLNRVDLPHPLGPMTETNSPSRTSSVTPSSARTGSCASVSNTFDTFAIFRISDVLDPFFILPPCLTRFFVVDFYRA